MSGHTDLSADEALKRLLEGNARFLHGQSRAAGGVPRETVAELALGQRPYALILGCSDSRVPPETIFDAGLGELFVVRVAGNVLCPEVAASIQYACTHLEVPLVLVLGHQGCGAIGAALASKYQSAQQRSRIALLVDVILPSLEGLDPGLPEPERLARAVEMNVRRTVEAIADSPEGRARRAEGRIRCVGAIYEIQTGGVRVLEPAAGPT